MLESQAAQAQRIRQSIVRWTYRETPLEELCKRAAEIGYVGIDVLTPTEFAIPARYGLECTMGFVGLGDNKSIGINRLQYHDQFEQSLRQHAPSAQKNGVKSVIALCGPRGTDISDDEGKKNCVTCLKRLAPIAADYGLTICLEPQNSKRDHPGYMCDRLDWAIDICEQVGNSNVRLLFDIYHMQIMEGNLIETIRNKHEWFHHYHTGGVPGRHELDDKQEINYPAVMRAILQTGFIGVVAHEYVPLAAPLDSLFHAFKTCNV